MRRSARHSRPAKSRWRCFFEAVERFWLDPFSNIGAARPHRPRPRAEMEAVALRILRGKFGLPRSLRDHTTRPPACQPFDVMSEGTSSRGPQRGTGSAPNCLETSRIP